MVRVWRLAWGLVVLMAGVTASAEDAYKKPPANVLAVLNAPPTPAASVSPTGQHLMLVTNEKYPPVADLAEPSLRLAGVRLNPKTNGPDRAPRVSAVTIRSLTDLNAKPVQLKLPAGRVSFPTWSPDGTRFWLDVTGPDGITLWTGTVASGELKQVPGVQLVDVLGSAAGWLPDNKTLLVRAVPAGRGKPPEKPAAPGGPVVQQSEGRAAPARTFPDLLKDAHDEALFDYYATSQLLAVDVESGKATPVGEPGLYPAVSPSPDGQYLLVTKLKRPYSYLLPWSAFPRTVEVWTRSGFRMHMPVADLPLQDKVPIEGVPTGPRAIRWVPNKPHTLTWVEALDDGDPRKKVPHRDAVFTAGVGGPPAEAFRLQHRFAGLDFFPDGGEVLVRDYDRDRKWSRTLYANLTARMPDEPKVVFERSSQDRYGDPGSPVGRVLPNGQRVLRTAGDALFLDGPGAGPDGDRPFLDRYDLKAKKADRVFQSFLPDYADVVAILDDAGKRLLIRRESPTTPPNLFLRDGDQETQLTDNKDPAPELRKAKKQLVTTKRADGVTLSFTLHTPPGYKDGDKLPAVLYAYPTEFASADTAGQVTGSPRRFTGVGGYSHLFFLLHGYAVIEAAMPVVGPPASANDTFVGQLVSNAKAAIDKAAELGVVDPGRVGVMGHSYGAFMTANLLAHSDLFKAGIGRSGAYNRTLTPFGFQNERRTFWEAPDVYGKMSPFNHADKIKTPLLLIHGAADNNPGTFTVQSERLYQAVRGTGGVVRLCLLPHESHGYEARESVEHVLYEQFAWFDKYVKAGGSRSK